MSRKIARRDTLKLIASASAATTFVAPAISKADTYPSRPIIIVNPFPPGGNVDNLARVISPALSKTFRQPVNIVNTPGADAMLGHEYFLRQPDDGYALLVDSANFVGLNILLQHAPFKIDDFWMINLPSRDYTLMATAISNETLKTVDDVIRMLKADPSSLSIGIERSSSDYVNFVQFTKAAGINSQNLRLVTFDGGGPTRTAIVGGVVDFGLVGAEGFLTLADQIRPLLTFATERQAPFASPALPEVKIGSHFDPVAGSLRGFAVHTTFKDKYQQRYAMVVNAFEAAFKDKKVIDMLNSQKLPSTWYGPENSNSIYLKTFTLLKSHVDLLQGN